ncbi:MAG: lysophospholipid acyltransferase family protein, partial [Polyangiales bacterium]
LLDIPFLFAELFERHDILLRGLGDHVHFRIPLWRDLLLKLGAVDGTRAECARLMRAGESILVFPGGAREVSKRKGERYRLLWKERLGFVRMAIEHDATIVPFSAVGIDDAFEVIVDADQLFASPIGPILRSLGVRSEAFLPFAVPRVDADRLYFKLGTPIRARDFASAADDDVGARALRDAVRDAVTTGIEELHAIRGCDPERRLTAGLRRHR